MIESDYKVHGTYSKANRVVEDKTGMHNGDIKIFRPDKDGVLQLVRTFTPNFEHDPTREYYNCMDCGIEDQRPITKAARGKKVRCVKCQTVYGNKIKADYRRKHRAKQKADIANAAS